MKLILKATVMVAALVTFCFAGGNMLKAGTDAPEFSLSAQDGSIVKLSDYKGKNSVVLIFYPGDQTPVCTEQLCEIRDDYSSFQSKGAVVFGINPGSEKSHQKFTQKHNFQFPLLVDAKSEVAKRYMVKGLFMNQRTVYVINTEGKIVYAKRGKPAVSEILENVPDNKN